MKFSAIFRFLCALLTVCFQAHTLLQSHGFCGHTLVKQCDISKTDTILSVCRKTVKRATICVPSYNTTTRAKLLHKKVLKGGKSNVPWYVRFSCSDTNQNPIACSPLQEFYSVDTNKWIPAYQRQVGDRLLSYRGFCTVTCVEYVERELKVYALEVEPPHTFFVGTDELLTHNMSLPESWVILAPAITFGSGTALSVGSGAAIGATLAPLLAPVIITAGLVLSGALGVLVKTICNDIIPTYRAAVSDVSNFFGADKKEHNKEGIKEEASQPTSASSPSGGPKKDDDKNKIKLSEKDKDHIFRKSEGHFPEDTPEIRRLLEDMVANKNNFDGFDKYETAWYSQIIQNGKQIWAGVRDNAIRYAGINEIPWLKDSATGLLIRP